MDLSLLEGEICRLLHPSIVNRIKNRGISMYLNTYIGYDTEYEGVSQNVNKLLSVQLAGNTNIYVNIPIIPGKPLGLKDF